MAKDWTKLYKKYRGKWVALDDDEITVLGSGDKAAKALGEARKKGFDNPILFKVPTKIIPLLGEIAV